MTNTTTPSLPLSAEQSEDSIVEANRQLLLERSRLGIRKYGVTLGAGNLSQAEFAQHALEEALDLANYLQGFIQRTPSRGEPSVEQMAQQAGFIVNECAEIVVPAPGYDARPHLSKFAALIAQARTAQPPAEQIASVILRLIGEGAMDWSASAPDENGHEDAFQSDDEELRVLVDLVNRARTAQQATASRGGQTPDGEQAPQVLPPWPEPINGLAHERETVAPWLSDKDIVDALHWLGIDTEGSKYGFGAIQVCGSSVPLIRRLVDKLANRAPSAPAMLPLSAGLPHPGEHLRVLVYTDGVDFNGDQYFDINTEDLWEPDPDMRTEVADAATHWMPQPRPAATTNPAGASSMDDEAKPFYFTTRQAEVIRHGLYLLKFNPRRHEDIATAERIATYLARPSSPSAEKAPGLWTVQHNGQSVSAETFTACFAAARKLRTPEEQEVAAANLAAGIAAMQAEEGAGRADVPVATYPPITTAEMAALNRFCECADDFDSGGYDVPKDMMKRLAIIGLVRSCGFGQYETTLFGDAIRARSAAPTAAIAEADAKDAREAVARAIWKIRREEEDRCDMDLEDIGEDHSVWKEADAAIAAISATQQAQNSAEESA